MNAAVAPVAKAIAKVAKAVAKAPVVPVVAVVVALAVAVVVWRRNAMEGFAFRGTTPRMSDKHREFVTRKCSTGTTWDELVSNDEWWYLSKYPEAEVRAACKAGEIDAARATSYGRSKATGADCVHGACPNEGLRAVRPCLNRAKTRCCVPGTGTKLTKCVDAGSAQNLDDALKSRKAAVDKIGRVFRGEESNPGPKPAAAAAAAPANASHSGYCLRGGKKVRDVTVNWGTGDNADLTWACNAWYAAECEGKCQGSDYWCSEGVPRDGTCIKTSQVGARTREDACPSCVRK